MYFLRREGAWARDGVSRVSMCGTAPLACVTRLCCLDLLCHASGPMGRQVFRGAEAVESRADHQGHAVGHQEVRPWVVVAPVARRPESLMVAAVPLPCLEAAGLVVVAGRLRPPAAVQ